jgi:hypothetical protein
MAIPSSSFAQVYHRRSKNANNKCTRKPIKKTDICLARAVCTTLLVCSRG